jgi:hypothetical protein
MGASDRLGACLAQAKMPDLAFFDQALHGSCDILDRHLRIDTMLIEQIDTVNAQATQRVLGDLANVGGPAVETVRSRFEVVAEFGGDYDIVPQELQRLADQFLIGEGAIDFGGVEESGGARLPGAQARSSLPGRGQDRDGD